MCIRDSSLLMRTLEDLRLARDRLNQNSTNSSRPSGSLPPWQAGGGPKAQGESPGQPDGQEGQDNTTQPEPPKDKGKNDDTDASPNKATASAEAAQADDSTKTAKPPTPRRAGRALGERGHGRSQKLT